MLGTVILPTFNGHYYQARDLVNSINATSEHANISLIISKDDRELFEELDDGEYCKLVFIEDLITRYCGVDISAADLLKSVGKFKFQAIKKILGVYYCSTELALILDSETNIVKDLDGIFSSGLEGTTVLYSDRKWEKIPPSLTTEVRDEVNLLLNQENDKWFFESFNWLYDSNLLRELVSSLELKYGKDWVFRDIPLFECQLYFQYAYNNRSNYLFMSVEALILSHFGAEYGKKILDRFWSSSFTFCGIIEYAGCLMSRSEYKSFITAPHVLQHLRLVRHEPSTIYNIVEDIRENCSEEYYYGEAAMHRGDFTRGKIAVLLSGNFHNQNDILNIKNFLSGVDCDIFVTTANNSYLVPQIEELLDPISIDELEDDILIGERSRLLSDNKSKEKDIKPRRDIGTISMFDKISHTFQLMKNYENDNNVRYEIIVRLRPDILSVGRLKDIFIQTAEHSQIGEDIVFFPNRFWSQGINDQFFFGKRVAMLALLEGVCGRAYIKADYLNPEYYLGCLLINKNLKPIAFDFKYILSRGDCIDIENISNRFSCQEAMFWSREIPSLCWKDLSKDLACNLLNVRIKNLEIVPPRLNTINNREVEFLYGERCNGDVMVFTSEHKSPYI